MQVDLNLWEKQLQYVSSDTKSVLLSCGVGFGKTYANAILATISIFKYPKSRIMMVARDIPQFKKAALPELLKVFDLFGLQEHSDYRFNRQSMEFTFNNGTVIQCVGANNYDSAFRGPNVSMIIADEAEYYKPDAWRTMLGRLRVEPELLRVSSTPNGFNFVYDFFIVNDNDKKEVIHATTYDNLALSREYVQMLKDDYSPTLFEQEVLAKRLNLKVGKVFSEFNREIHVKPCADELEEDDTIYFFTDYNVAHYCGVYLIFKKGKVYCIGEEHLEYKQTKDMAYKVRTRFPDHHIIVCGDSSGNNKRDVAIERVNYKQFQDAGLDTMNFRNPPVHARIISANSNLYHKKVIIDASCKTLIKDLELVSWKEGSNEVDKSRIDLSHSSDAFSYGLWHFLAVRINRKSKTIQL